MARRSVAGVEAGERLAQDEGVHLVGALIGEHGFQIGRMTDPDRAARLWLAVAVASPRRWRRATRLRLVSVFRRGWIAILAALVNQAPLPVGRFVPEPWPTRLDATTTGAYHAI